jgi:hypothetical protein
MKKWSEVEFATDSQSASLSLCRAHVWGPWPDFSLSFLMSLSCGMPSLTRGRVSNFQLVLGLISTVFLVYVSRGTHQHIFIISILRLPQLAGPHSCTNSRRNKMAQLCPRELHSLSVAPYGSKGYGGGILTRVHTEWIPASHIQSYLTTHGQSTSLC